MAKAEKPTEPVAIPTGTDSNKTASFADLTNILETETRLMRELKEALLRQRAAVASRDVETVDSETNRISQVLEQVSLVQTRRQEVLALLGENTHASLTEIERHVGVPLPASLQHARVGLAQAAREANHQLVINDTVLRRAVETETDFLQAVFSSLKEEPPSYRPHTHGLADPEQGAVLLNKVA